MSVAMCQLVAQRQEGDADHEVGDPYQVSQSARNGGNKNIRKTYN